MRDSLRKTFVALGFVATAGILGAAADVAVTAGSGTTIFAFTCFTSKVCPASVNVNSAGTEIGTAGSPLFASVTNTNSNGRALPSASSPVVLPSQTYETVAASQTGQAMGPTGGTGDYLSHCTIYPGTTSPGVVTVFDNTSSAANNVIAFTGGASSVSNLVPFSVPVGAISANGAWKVTTGANVIVTCVGNFT